MQILRAETVYVWADSLDYGYGEVSFQWFDPMYGHEGLSFTLDGHCSREMPIRSGDGSPILVNLCRNRVQIGFDRDLAGKLSLDEVVEVEFEIGEHDFNALKDFWSEYAEIHGTEIQVSDAKH